MALQKLACAELRVDCLDEAVRFNAEVLGLYEIGREGRRAFMSCGSHGHSAQLILREGGTGVDTFTVGVDSEADISACIERLHRMGIEGENRGDPGSGQPDARRFMLPTGQAIELMPMPERPAYEHPVFNETRQRHGVAPRDIDHITLAFCDDKAGRAAAEVLKDGLGFAISELLLDSNGDWLAAWTRVGEQHHDVGLIRCQSGATLHHLAWRLDSADHLKTAADTLAGAGYGLETGPGRHGVGGNLYAYFWAPGGNRYELSAEMPLLVGGRREPLVRSAASFNSFSAWGASRPESFTRGS